MGVLGNCITRSIVYLINASMSEVSSFNIIIKINIVTTIINIAAYLNHLYCAAQFIQ